MDLIGSSYAGWSALLVLGVPFCIIMLNEYSERLKRRNSNYLSALEFTRDVVLPFLVLLIVLRLVFSVDDGNVPAKVISTLFWFLLMFAVFRYSRAFLGSGDYQASDWRSKVPALFLRLPTYTIAGLICFHIIQNLWALPVTEMATTLGIGSVAIALALQDTLSNLVSGLLLVANSPFKPGEWIKVDSVEGKVLTVNSRYTHIESWNGDLVVIPNGSISRSSIQNFSRPSRNTLVSNNFDIGFDSPPNEVKRVFLDTLHKTPHILKNPPPAISLVKIGNPICEYCVEFWIDDHEKRPDVLEDFLTRIWYAQRRAKLTVPMNAINQFSIPTISSSLEDQDSRKAIAGILGRINNFASLDEEHRETLCNNAQLLHYAATERILDIGEREQGVYILASGSVELFISNGIDEHQPQEQLNPGAIFGESGLFQRAFSKVNAVAKSDCELLIVEHSVFNTILDADARLSTEINSLVNRRNATSKSPDATDIKAETAKNKITSKKVQHVE